MHSHHSTQHSEIVDLFRALKSQLSDIPELEPAFTLIDDQLEMAINVFVAYISLIQCMAQLDGAKLKLIQKAHTQLQASGGVGGSASSLSVSDMILSLGENKDLLDVIAVQSSDTRSSYFEPAMKLLTVRLRDGHLLKLSGKAPSDHDPESLQVIWGHTLIIESTSMLHFLICHYLEKYFAKALQYKIDSARNKDFFINALTDVVIINRHDNVTNHGIFERWMKSKAEGGLGWITKDRATSYGIDA